jgi:hypothetical protein
MIHSAEVRSQIEDLMRSLRRTARRLESRRRQVLAPTPFRAYYVRWPENCISFLGAEDPQRVTYPLI